MIPSACRTCRAKELRFPLNVLFGFNKKWMEIQNVKTLVQMKPPNILILSQKSGRSLHWKRLLENSLARDSYVIYELERKELAKSYWSENVSLFVLDHILDLEKEEKEYLDNFIKKGGSTLVHCSSYPVRILPTNENADCVFQTENGFKHFSGFVHSFTPGNLDVPEFEPLCHTGANKSSIIFSKRSGLGRVVISTLDFLASIESNSEEEIAEAEKANILLLLELVIKKLNLKCSSEGSSSNVTLTPGFLFGISEDVNKFVSSIKIRLAEEPKIKTGFEFVNPVGAMETIHATQDRFPVISCASDEARRLVQQHFRFQDYLKNLRTKRLGRIAIYSHTVISTQQILEMISSSLSAVSDGLLIIAGQQLQGRGRGGNQWLSPDGCMMFSLALSIDMSSELGRRLPYVQHIAVVAVVNAIREIPGYEEIQIRIKWPNDIYFGSNIKIGGLIVNSSVSCGKFRAIIGLGLNVSNSQPTVCLHRIIDQYNMDNGTKLKHLSIEELLAYTVTNIEQLLQQFDQNGHKEFCKLYYKYWLHSDQQIRLGNNEGEQVIVKGLDDNGFLLVERKTGEVLSVQPDGNSFDMMNGLILVKGRT